MPLGGCKRPRVEGKRGVELPRVGLVRIAAVVRSAVGPVGRDGTASRAGRSWLAVFVVRVLLGFFLVVEFVSGVAGLFAMVLLRVGAVFVSDVVGTVVFLSFVVRVGAVFGGRRMVEKRISDGQKNSEVVKTETFGKEIVRMLCSSIFKGARSVRGPVNLGLTTHV